MIFLRSIKFFLAMLIMAVLAGCATQSATAPDQSDKGANSSKVELGYVRQAADPDLVRLLLLMQQRLNLAEDVAMFKWNTKTAVDDPVREQQILDALARQAPQYGLAPKSAQDFFAAQIVAGKMIQSALFIEWVSRHQAPFSNSPDLKTEIRPALDQLTIDLLTALARTQSLLSNRFGQHAIEIAAAETNVRAGIKNSVPAYALAWQKALTGLIKIAQP